MLKRLNRNLVLTFGIGMFCGFFLFYIMSSMLRQTQHYGLLGLSNYESYEYSHGALESADGPNIPVQTHSHSEIYHRGEATESKRLAKEVRVLCWVMTSPKNHDSKAKHIKATWGQRCKKLIFMSTQEDKTLGSIALNISEGRNYLWGKTKHAFRYIYHHHLNDADWFLKADDDTYVVIENLRYMLSSYNSSDTVYFGCRFKPYVNQGYMSGGAGYVLSKAAVEKFVKEALPDEKKCKKSDSGAEDVEIGKCLEAVGVSAVDSRDNLGRGRFFPFVPESHVVPINYPSGWYRDYIYYPVLEGFECCSDTSISFHYVPPKMMYVLEFLIYHLRPYGINFQAPFPALLPPDKRGIPQHVIDEAKTKRDVTYAEGISPSNVTAQDGN